MQTRFQANIALRDAQTLSAEALCAQAHAMWPGEPLVDLAPLISIVAPDEAGGGTGFMLTAAGQHYTILFIARPLTAYSFTPRPEAAEAAPVAIADHGAHVAVSTSGALRTQAEIVQAASVASVLVAALTTLLPSVAVIWDTSATITPPDIFRESAMALHGRRIPVAEWVGFRWGTPIPSLDGPPLLGLVTTGLRPFIGREIELVPSPLPRAVLAQQVTAACSALILSATAAETQTLLGHAHAEHITLEPRSEGRRPGIPVLEMRVEPPGAISAPAPLRFGRRRAE